MEVAAASSVARSGDDGVEAGEQNLLLAAPDAKVGKSCFETLTDIKEILLENMQIRYDGVLQIEGEVYDIRFRNLYVWLEYSNVLLALLLYPLIPILLIDKMTINNPEKPECFTSDLMPYYCVLAVESIYFVFRAALFAQTWRKRNGSYKTMVYNQIGGLWLTVDEPIGFRCGQFLKDMVAGLGVFFGHVDIYANIVSVLVMINIHAALAGLKVRAPEATPMQIVLYIMVATTVLKVIPRIVCVVMVPVAMLATDIEKWTILKCFGNADFDERSAGFSTLGKHNNAKRFARYSMLSRIFNFGENTFIPLLFPPNVMDLNAEEVKHTLRIKLSIIAFKVLFFTLPQSLCQFYFTKLVDELGCSRSSSLPIYVSIVLSVGLGIFSLYQAWVAHSNYRNVEATLFINKFLKGNATKDRPTILSTELTHENFKAMAEYYLKQPSAFDEINIEKGKITGYNKDIKIKVPSGVDANRLFRVRINFTPGYVAFATEADHQIVLDFVRAFPKLALNPGFGVSFPRQLKEQIQAMEHVEITKGGF